MSERYFLEGLQEGYESFPTPGDDGWEHLPTEDIADGDTSGMEIEEKL